MASAERPSARRRIRLVVTGAVVLTALTVATAGASAPSQLGVRAPEMARPARTTGTGTRPRTPSPGFLLDKGRFSGFDAPGASMQTGPLGIDERRRIVGNYIDAAGAYHGFLREPSGRFTTIDVPGAMATQPETINNRGQIVGSYSTTAAQLQAPNGKPRGFLLERGRFTRIDVPGAVQTQAKGINERAQVVGEYLDAAGKFHGFLWQKGRFTTIDLPGAAATSPTDINDLGEILGVYTDPGDAVTLHGFLLSRGRSRSFDAPGGPVTFALDVNNRGQIVGFSFDGANLTSVRSFLLAKGVKGPFSTVTFPGAPLTLAAALNDHGQLVGSYQNPDVATPNPQTTSAPPPMQRMS
jgi:probable HAF family extracellular repeat protein